MSEALKGKPKPWLQGRPKPEETRKKMSEAKKNMSEETRRKISEARKGVPKPKLKWLTPEGTIVEMGKGQAHRYHPDWIEA